MSSSVREKVMRHLEAVGQMQPALHHPTHAPSPDEITHTLFRAYTRSSHDVGGEADISIPWEEKEEEVWEHNTFVTCEVLAWRGVWNAEERRRRQNVDVGQTQYLGLPYYGRWLLTAARILIDKQYVTLTEMVDKLDDVKKRLEGGEKYE
jgi:Nitrile hydratase beta subunit, N-terminal